MASVMEVPSGLHMPGLVDGKAPKGGLSEANDSPQTAHLPSPDIESSQSEAAPRSRITGTDPQSLAPLFQAFKDKLYYSGFVYKRRDLDQNGRRIVLKEGEQQWAPFWVELKGSVMQFRSADGVSLDDADMLLGKAPAIAELKERQEDPSCIDVSEACMVVVADPSGPGPSPTSTVTAHSDAHTLTPASAERPHSRAIDAPSVNFIYSFNMTTAGCNLYTIACPSVHMRDGWLFAIRLAQFEFARLCEAFTGRLLRKQGIAGTSWTDMGVDRNSLKPVLAHKPGHVLREGWVLARVTYESEWRRFWCTIVAGDENNQKTLPVTMSVPSLAQKSNALKRLFSVRTKSDAVKNERLAKVALYADKKDVKRKKDPVVVIDGCSSAFAVYPEKPEMVMGAGSFKIESDRIGMRWDLLHGLEGKSAPELPAPTFVLFMLPTLQELASYMIALCSTMPEAGAAIQEAEGELASCDFDSADSSLWLSVPEVVSFLPLLRKLPIMPPKAEFLAMMAEKQRMGGADINRRSGWTQSVLAQWNEWLSSGIRKQVTEISLQIPVASLSKPVSVASAAKAPAAEKAKPSRIDEALRRAYDIAVLVEANTKVSPSRNTSRNPSRNPSPPRNDPPQSPAFSFAQGPDILSTMVSPVFETVPAVSDQRSFVPSAPTALEESEVERPIAALAEADATLAISEDDIPLAARAKAQVAATTIEPEPATSEEIPCSIEEEQEEEEELLRKSGSNASLASEPAYGGLLDIEDEPEPEQDAEPKTVVTLHDLLIKEEVDENRLSPMQGQGSMVLVAVPSPVVTETGEQAWDWEYQLVDRTELQAKVVSPVLERNPSAHGTGDGIIGDQQVAPMPELFAPVAGAETSLSVEKPVALKVVTRPIVGIEGDDQCLSQPDTMVPSGTSANPPPTTVIERQEPAIRQTLAAAPVRTPASEFHTPSNSEPAPIQASANVNAAPVPVAIPVPGLVPAVGPTNDNDEDRPLQARSSQVSLNLPLGPSDSASVVAQQILMQQYSGYFGQPYPGMPAPLMLPNGQPAMPMARPGMYPAGAARSVVMPSGPYPAAPYPPQAVPMMPMASGAQSVVGAPYPAVPYPMSQVGVGMMGMPMMGFVDPYEFDDSASVRARNSLAMAWLEREREKERQRQHERQLEQQMPAFAPPSAAALQAFPQMANMPPVLPGSVVFIPGYGYVQQPQPSSQQNGMWSGIISAYGSVAPSARPSRPSSNAGSVRSFTSQMQANRTRATKSRQVSVAAPTIGEGDNDEDVPLHTLPRQASAVAGIGANGQKADANPSSSARVLPRSKIQPPSASYHQAALQVPVSKVAGGSPKPAAKQ